MLDLPIDRIFLPGPRLPRLGELPFRLKVFGHRDIENTDSDFYYRCVYCGMRLSGDYEPWERLYRLCDFCESWYRYCFGHRDERWIQRQYANMVQRIKRRTYRRQGVEVRIDRDAFYFLAQTLLVPFRFYYPFQRPSVDRHFRTSADWPNYAWSTIAIVPQPLNSILRAGCMSMDKLVRLCQLLRGPHYHGRNRELARELELRDSCISDIARGKRFQTLCKYDARLLELFKDAPGDTPEPTMWNWSYGVDPESFAHDPVEHDKQLAEVLKHDAYAFD